MLTRNSEKLLVPLWIRVLIALLVAGYIAINIFALGGDAFVIALNNVAANPLALMVVLVTLLLWRNLAVGRLSRQLWFGLLLGWILWTVGEFWWTIAAYVGGEVPYPSGADLFWLLGNVVMGAALWLRLRSLPEPSRKARAIGWGVATVFISMTVVFVLLPLLRDPDPSWLTNALNLLYPALDLTLLVLVLQILLTYRQGIYGAAWTWLGAGFALHSVSNLVFSAADTMGLYLPNQRLNLISTLGVDVPYTLGYGAWLVGLGMLAKLLSRHHARQSVPVKLVPVPDTHVVVFCGADDRVMGVSRNHGRVFAPKMIGELPATALGLAPEELIPLLQRLKTARTQEPRTFMSKCQLGTTPISISGIVVTSMQGKYQGVTLLVQLVTGDPTLDELLTSEEHLVARSLLKKTGAEVEEEAAIKQLLSGFYMAQLQALRARVLAAGGGIMVDALQAELRAEIAQQGLRVPVSIDSGLDMGALSLEEVRGLFPILLEKARSFVARLSSEEEAEAIIQEVRASLDPIVMQQVARLG
ncbi:MAG: hypothetical protein JW892_17110 [Anaerolineae bacterium]|nr:hypothetical protein [Anaerolineae bacterium]